MKKLLFLLLVAALSLSVFSCGASITGKWYYEDSVVLIFARNGELTVSTTEQGAVEYTFSYEAVDGKLSVGGASVLSSLIPDFIPLDGAAYTVEGKTLIIKYSGEEYALYRAN